METEPKLIDAYVKTGKLKLIYRHLLQLGAETERASEASECAADQGAFWPMRTMIYQRQSEIYSTGDLDATLRGFATDLKLDGAAFDSCMRSGTHRAAIAADYRAAEAAGITSRPVFEIGGQRLVGSLPFEQFQQAIEAALGK